MFDYEILTSFNELEHEIYEYIIKNLEAVPFMRIRELAEATHVSTATILRFCKKTGCEGYSEFKIMLKQYAESRRGSFQLKKNSFELLHFFESFYSDEYNQIAQKIAEQLYLANQIIFIGVGNSSSIALYGSRYFANIGKMSFAITDPFFPIRAISERNQNEKIVVIFLTISGETKEILQLQEQFHILGAKTVSITSSKNSSIGQLTDDCIPFYLKNIRDKDIDISSQIATVAWIERLGREVLEIQQSVK
ncbi:MurR/RpiR family transcriptional regulator [Streptococcus marmotae]|uniref:MurR/RpiR family transcriptional regulator n=1 Tax=Streptococcus marmotae TaxID=1825069 RepID=UPI00082A0399|nr:MurR/RpiR family transcriptional regulator [Streptococcus marmotae]